MTAFDISPARLRAKKIARRMAVGLSRSIRRRDSPADGSIRVLTYHRFGASPLDPCCLSPRSFEAQLDWLREHANVLAPAEFDAAMRGLQPAPRDAVLITIDDGHRSAARHALPALERRGMQAILFVCPALLSPAETTTPATDEAGESGAAFMSRGDLIRAACAGHTIAPHGHSHRSLGRMPLAQAIAEIDQACAALQPLPGAAGPFFSFPFGTRADYSPALARELQARGFRYCFTATHGRCRPRGGSALLPRIKIEGGNEDDLFPDIVRGCMDHWRLVDGALYALQQRGRM
ncbi:MAG: polysaccharide deacetylase family protein [Lautropia sp.]